MSILMKLMKAMKFFQKRIKKVIKIMTFIIINFLRDINVIIN